MSLNKNIILQFKTHSQLFEFRSLIEKHTHINIREKVLSCQANHNEIKIAKDYYGATIQSSEEIKDKFSFNLIQKLFLFKYATKNIAR